MTLAEQLQEVWKWECQQDSMRRFSDAVKAATSAFAMLSRAVGEAFRDAIVSQLLATGVFEEAKGDEQP